MAKGAAGFRKLRDKFVTSINDRACNVVRIKTACGKTYKIEAEVVGLFGIPFLTMTEEKEKQK